MSDSAPRQSGGSTVVFVGSGDAFGSGARYQACLAVTTAVSGTVLDGIGVRAVEVEHACGAPQLAVAVEVGGRRLAYSGDTARTPALFEVSRGADIFVDEAELPAAHDGLVVAL